MKTSIPERDPYDTLGVTPISSKEEVKSAYRRRSKETHPDLNPGKDYFEFRMVNEAYDWLMANLGTNWNSETAIKQAKKPSGFSSSSPTGFDEYFNGVELRVRVTNACRGCIMNFSMNGIRMTVKIPPGIQNGSNVKAITQDGKYQTTIIVRLIDDPEFQMVGMGPWSILKTVSIDRKILQTGASIIVEDVFGKTLSVKIPMGHDPKTDLRIPGHGLPMKDNDGNTILFGSMYLRIVPI